MEATVSYLLMLQKYINSKQKNLHCKRLYKKKKDYTLFLVNISKDFTSNNMKKIGLKRSVKFLLLTLILLILTICKISIDISWKENIIK